MHGVVMHTMVCNLPQCIDLFNNPKVQASAFFGVAQDGTVHQFGPLLHNWEAWAQKAGNAAWYSIEFADNKDPNNPLTAAQIAAGAQLVELLSRIGHFPLEITNDPNGTGFGVHNMGGQDWGGHSCPDMPPRHVRSAQRGAILELSKVIRSQRSPQQSSGPQRHEADGNSSLDQIAAGRGTSSDHLIHVTRHSVISEPNLVAFNYYVRGGTQHKMPKGLVYYTSN
jgi:N-acetylmuramoyl-L-alanine amidase